MKHYPIRMCVVCRKRLLQKELLRLQQKNQQIINYCFIGRSFYSCYQCVSNEAKLLKCLKKQLKNNHLSLNFNLN